MSEPEVYIGPCVLPCGRGCKVPEGFVAVAAQPEDSWGKVSPCPNADCSRGFVVMLNRNAEAEIVVNGERVGQGLPGMFAALNRMLGRDG